MQYRIQKNWVEKLFPPVQLSSKQYQWLAIILLLLGISIFLFQWVWVIGGLSISVLYLLLRVWRQNELMHQLQDTNQQMQFLQKAFDSIPNYIFVKDDQGKYVLANRAFAERHNHTTHSILGKSDHDLYSQFESEQYEQDDLAIMHTNEIRMTPELQVIDHKTGNPRWVQLVKVPLALDGQQAQHILAIITDITEQKQQRDTLQKTNKAHAEFVAYASHDIKSPLTALQMSVGYLLELNSQGLNDKQIRTLQSMMRSIEQINNLVQDLSMLMQVESAEFILKKTAVSLNQVIDKILLSMESAFASRNHQVNNLVAYDLPLLDADPHRLAQILINLISNAHKYTPEGGQITIAAQQTPNDKVCVCVIDNGLGIREEEQEKLFDHFFRSSDREANQQSGSGLGLSVTKKLVEAHNGQIWFESTYREGTSFHIELPIARQAFLERAN